MSKLMTWSLVAFIAASSPSAVLGQATPDIPTPPPPPPTTPTPDPAPDPAPTPAAPPAADPAPAAAAPPPVTLPPKKAAPEKKKAPVAPPPAAKMKTKRAGRLAIAPHGFTGLLRVASADSVDPGLIRLGFALDLFKVGSFFTPDDGHSRVAGTLSLSGAPMDYLELWLNLRASSNSNGGTNPTLLQSLGDLQLGAKGFYPVAKAFSIGADAQVRFLSGVGSTSFDFGSTELRLRALMTADLSQAIENLPIRGHLNIGFTLDNSDSLIPEGGLLSNAERFALGVSDFNRLGVGLGIEVPVKYVTPYIEYNVEFPLGYLATPGVVLQSSQQALRPAQETPDTVGDPARPAIQRVIPQVITPGVRITAIPKLTIDMAVEIGITPDVGVGVLGVPAYNVVLAASYPLDPFATTQERGPPVTVPLLIPEEVEKAPTGGTLAGMVKDKSSNKAIAGAVIEIDRSTPIASGADGRFVSHEIEAGPIAITVSKEGYEVGKAQLELASQETAEIEVALAPSIKEGTIRGKVSDPDDKVLANARVIIEGPSGSEQTTDAQGGFTVVAREGKYRVVVDQEGYLRKSREFDLKGGETVTADIVVRKRPEKAAVEIKGDRIVLADKVHFVTGEARLRPDASALLDQVMDVMTANPQIKRIRVEGHTDNVGGNDFNMKLSRDRAQSVVDYLVEQGLDRSRMVSEGFGPTKPIAPNLTRRGREQNRRVEFHILEQTNK